MNTRNISLAVTEIAAGLGVAGFYIDRNRCAKINISYYGKLDEQMFGFDFMADGRAYLTHGPQWGFGRYQRRGNKVFVDSSQSGRMMTFTILGTQLVVSADSLFVPYRNPELLLNAEEAG